MKERFTTIDVFSVLQDIRERYNMYASYLTNPRAYWSPCDKTRAPDVCDDFDAEFYTEVVHMYIFVVESASVQ